MKKTLGAIVLAGTMALSSGCHNRIIDRFDLGKGYECEVYNNKRKIILYHDGKRFARVEFKNPPAADTYTEDPNYDSLIAALLYVKCREMILEKYPPKK